MILKGKPFPKSSAEGCDICKYSNIIIIIDHIQLQLFGILLHEAKIQNEVSLLILKGV